MIFGIIDSSDSQNSEKNMAQSAKLLDQTSKILFFIAKLDERARIIVPAPIRKRLGISFGAVVFVGIEKVRSSESAKDFSKKAGGDSNEN